MVLALSLRYIREGGFYQGEYYFLLMTAFLGCLLMPASRDLLMLFISLELVSAPGFLMAAFRKGDLKGNEGGLKFFIIGVLSTAVMLYGMSMIVGLTGQTQLRLVADAIAGLARAARARPARRVDPVRRRRVRLQGQRGAVPVLGARHLRGLARCRSPPSSRSPRRRPGFAGLLQLMFVAFLGPSDVLGRRSSRSSRC